MNTDIERKIFAILKILSEGKSRVGASIISRRLKDYGIDLTERAVRYHLKIMDERGLTQGKKKEGRIITPKGLEELSNALVADKVGLVISKIDTLSFLTDFDFSSRRGKVVLNISLLPNEQLKKSFCVMRDVFKEGLCISDLVAAAGAGEKLGEMEVPRGMFGFGTVCSVTIHGILIKQGIPVEARFGGILQVENHLPTRFTDLITYEGSSLDPLEVFIRSKMTSVREVAKSGNGKLLASFREIPAASLEHTQEIFQRLSEVGFKGILVVGKPSQPVLEVSVGLERVGVVIAGGLNPLAALSEASVEAENKAMSTLVEFSELQPFQELFKGLF